MDRDSLDGSSQALWNGEMSLLLDAPRRREEKERKRQTEGLGEGRYVYRLGADEC